jgi:DNA-directed RNA polymerase subunit M
MEFCPKCGSVIVEKRKNFGCMNCSYVSKGKVKIESSEQMKELKKTAVLQEKDSNTMPVTSAVCPKCGNKEAFFWTSQTRSGDEAETRFFRCTKCKHTWREYH